MFMSQREKIVMMGVDAHNSFVSGKIGAAHYANVMGSVLTNVLAISLYNIAFAALIYKERKTLKDFFMEALGNLVGLTYVGRAANVVVDVAEKSIEGRPRFGNGMDTMPAQFIENTVVGMGELTGGILMLATGNQDKFKSGPREDELKSIELIKDGTKRLLKSTATAKGLPWVGPKYIHTALENWGVIGEDERSSKYNTME